MPNDVWNTLTVLGDPDRVADFAATARGRPGRWDDKEGVFPLSMDALVPVPRRKPTPQEREFAARLYPDRDPDEAVCDAGVQEAHWGVKWGCRDLRGGGRGRTAVLDPGLASYTFGTAWSYPDAFLATVSSRWPNLTFAMSWGGEGPTAGRAVYRAGEGREDEGPDYEYPRLPPDGPEGEDGWSVAWDDAVRRFREDHARWVTLLAAATTGRRFVPDTPVEILADWLRDRGCGGHAAEAGAVKTAPVEVLYP